MLIFNKKYRIRKEEAGGFIYDTKTGTVFVANDSAAAICDFLKHKHTRQSITRHLSGLYPEQEIAENSEVIDEFIAKAVENEFFVDV